VLQGHVFSSVSVSISAAWRWLKVPRRESCPVSGRDVVLEQAGEGQSLAHAVVDDALAQSHFARCSKALHLGVDVEARDRWRASPRCASSSR